MDLLLKKIEDVMKGNISLEDPDIFELEKIEISVDLVKIKQEIDLAKKIDILRTQYEDNRSIEEYQNKVKLEIRKNNKIGKYKKSVTTEDLKDMYEDFEF